MVDHVMEIILKYDRWVLTGHGWLLDVYTISLVNGKTLFMTQLKSNSESEYGE